MPIVVFGINSVVGTAAPDRADGVLRHFIVPTHSIPWPATANDTVVLFSSVLPAPAPPPLSRILELVPLESSWIEQLSNRTL